MNSNLSLSIIISISGLIITIIGWFFLHELTKRRDNANKRKELRITYLIEVYRKLEYVSNRSNIDTTEYMEKSMADIQLLGTKKQVELAQAVIKEMSETHEASLDELLYELKQDLRKELNLETVPYPNKYLRIHK